MPTATPELITTSSETSLFPAIVFPIDEDEIREQVAPCLKMTIAGIDDRKGFDAVHEKRMQLKNLRVGIEKTRKSLKEASLEYGRTVDGEAKRLTALIAPAEDYLEAREKEVTAERERLKREAEEARQRKIQERFDQMLTAGARIDVIAVGAMSDDEFAAVLATSEAEQKAAREKEEAERRERERVAAEEAARVKAEAERLEAEAAERRRIEDARLAEERARLDAEHKAHQEQLLQREAELAAARREIEERERKVKEEADRLAAEKALAEPQPLTTWGGRLPDMASSIDLVAPEPEPVLPVDGEFEIVEGPPGTPSPFRRAWPSREDALIDAANVVDVALDKCEQHAPENREAFLKAITEPLLAELATIREEAA